ncbi:hypothetical protein HYV79_03645 [Candidatus Woesearchaeota archaeon]|nr:hypothetical protein [Candidatus Woesearchaeota archaeon]
MNLPISQSKRKLTNLLHGRVLQRNKEKQKSNSHSNTLSLKKARNIVADINLTRNKIYLNYKNANELIISSSSTNYIVRFLDGLLEELKVPENALLEDGITGCLCFHQVFKGKKDEKHYIDMNFFRAFGEYGTGLGPAFASATIEWIVEKYGGYKNGI